MSQESKPMPPDDKGETPMAGANAPSPADNPPEPDMPSPAGSVPGVDGGAAGDPAADDLWSDDDIVGTTAAAQPISPTLSADDAADWNLEDVNWAAPPPSPPAPEPTAGIEFMAQIKHLLRQGQALWRRLLAGVRSRLPITAQWPDALLGGILIGILLLLLTLTNGLQGRPSAAVSEGAGPTPAPTAVPPPSPEANPPAPPAPEPVDPAVIGEVQTQLTAAAALYGDGLVQSVQVSLNRSRLTVNLSADWYRLTATAQTDLVADLQQRSQALAFHTLEVRSPDDALLARSPVVGDAMVILQRQPLPEVPQPERPRYRLLID